MYLGPASQIRPRTLALLFGAGVLLLLAERSQAAALAPAEGAPPEAELIVRGQVAELRLRGLDAARLRERLAAGASPRFEIHLDGQRLLVAELSLLRFAEEAPVIWAALPPADDCLGLDRLDGALDAALRTSALDAQAPSAEPAPAKLSEESDADLRTPPRDALVPVPEPSTAPLLGAGLLGLLLMSRRRL